MATPIECSPEVFSKLLRDLGGPELTFTEIYDFDSVTSYVPSPCIAMVFVYPSNNPALSERTEQPGLADGGLCFAKQVIHNTCGTLALIHAVFNSVHPNLFHGPLKEAYEVVTAQSTPELAGQKLAEAKIFEYQNNVCCEGQSAVPTNDVEEHFVAFVQSNGLIFELDGTRPSPVCHGRVENCFLKEVCRVVQKLTQISPETHFSAMAISEKINA